MRRLLVTLVGLMAVTGLAVAGTHGDGLMTPDHPLYDAKTAGESGVENLAADEAAEAQAKVDHAEKRAEEANQLAQDGNDDLAADTADDYGEKMQDVNDLGDRVSDLAQQQEIDELVAEATEHHADVLSEVHENVPEEAQDAIADAMDRSIDGHEQATQRMADRGEPVDDFDIGAHIPDDVADQVGIDLDDIGPSGDIGQPNGAN